MFAGAGTNGYLALLRADPAVAASADHLTLHFSTNKDYIGHYHTGGVPGRQRDLTEPTQHSET